MPDYSYVTARGGQRGLAPGTARAARAGGRCPECGTCLTVVRCTILVLFGNVADPADVKAGHLAIPVPVSGEQVPVARATSDSRMMR